MCGEGDRVWVVSNGEIYNYRELSDELRARGHTFRTRSDTEAIVHAYEEHGAAALERLDGMFAVALWDESAGTLLLARDRLGIKPLYYACLPDGLVFASELRAILAHPTVDRRLDFTSLSQYLSYEYVPAPRSIVAGLRKLPAGHWLSYIDGQVKVAPYWDLDVRRQPRTTMAE